MVLLPEERAKWVEYAGQAGPRDPRHFRAMSVDLEKARDTGIESEDLPKSIAEAAGDNPRVAWGPAGDHTLCAMVHDLRVCARYARTQHGQLPAVTCGNTLPPFSGGQVVAGSNPVSPTRENAGQRPVDG